MKDEKNWNKTDVRTLKADVLEQFVLQCYKYQKYKTPAAMLKINRGSYSEHTAKAYLDYTKQYLTHGTKSRNIPQKVYQSLDKFKANHVAVLTPTEDEKYIPRKLKSSSPTPSIKIHPHAKKMIKEIQQINYPQYGVKYENTIKVFDNKEFCLGYKECFEVFNTDKKAEIVKVHYELVEENNNDGNA